MEYGVSAAVRPLTHPASYAGYSVHCYEVQTTYKLNIGVLIAVIHIRLHNLCFVQLLPCGERPMISNVLSNYSIRYQFTRGSPLLIDLTIKLSEAPFLGHVNLEKKQVLPTSL